MIFPPKLRKGDCVALVSPSSPLAADQPVERVAHAVEDLGFRVRIGDSCRGADAGGYGAGPAEVRAGDLNAAFADPTVRAIWCTRGGSTAARLLPLLDYRCIAANPKPFIGFSDITTLHLAFQRRCCMVTFHGPNANRALGWENEEDFSWRSLWAALSMDCCLPFQNPTGEAVEVIRPGRARGVLTGGNLALVAASMGTPWQVDPRGRVLFLEDVGEPVYALERSLNQLKLAGVFDQAAGVLLGAFTDWSNSYRPGYGPRELMGDFFACYPKPVLCNVRSAHVPVMATLPMGTVCHVDGEKISFIRC